MIYIDLPADLNVEDDQGRNIARLSDAVTPEMVTPGAVLVAGTPRAWSWAVVEAVEDGSVYFRQVSARKAAQCGSLVAPLPRGPNRRLLVAHRQQPDPEPSTCNGYRGADIELGGHDWEILRQHGRLLVRCQPVGRAEQDNRRPRRS
jgi:hypothetical protein